MFRLKPGPSRLPIAIRAALGLGLPVVIGWAVGHIEAGMMATLGGFTALYSYDRPYRSRAKRLFGIALAIALVVSLGMWADRWAPVAIPFTVLVAMLATFLCNSLRIGPPGAYLIVLAGAAGTAMPALPLPVWQVGVLVFAGGVLAWLVLMSGALFNPRGPERRAVATAAEFVARFAEATGAGHLNARHAAALALHDAWAALVTYQSARPRPDGVLMHLRVLNRALHLMFVAAANMGDKTDENLTTLAARARAIGAQALSPDTDAERTDPARVPLGHLGLRAAFRENLKLPSPVLNTALRVGLATALAGVVGVAIGFERAYWAMAAAVLILHQGLDWMRTLQRGVERMVGTLVGLGLAAAILALEPQGFELAIAVILLQFIVEILVLRNYALAVVFITAFALVLGTGGLMVPDAGQLFLARGADTIIGCVAGLIVHLLSTTRRPATPIRHRIAETLAMIPTVLDIAASGQVTTDTALDARRQLQHTLFRMVAAYEMESGGMTRQRHAADQFWPAVAATQRLGYRVLAGCWAIEEAGPDGALSTARDLLPPDALDRIKTALAALAAAFQTGATTVTLPPLPDFLEIEIRNLSDSLVPETQTKA